MPPFIIPQAEPFFFPGGPVGCLLVHGLTGAPKEMRGMGEALAKHGYSVLGVRLPGHATQISDLLRTRWTDWLAAVEDGWHQLHGISDHIYVMGLSMGGILSLLFAAHQPVSGVVAISTPYALPPDPRLRYIRLLRWVIPKVEKGPSDSQNPGGVPDHIEYPYYPTLAIAELRDLLAEMRKSLPLIRVPVLLVHSRLDHKPSEYDPDSMAHIYEHLGTTDKQMMWVENSGHVIPEEPDRWLVFDRIHQFIQEHEHQMLGTE